MPHSPKWDSRIRSGSFYPLQDNICISDAYGEQTLHLEKDLEAAVQGGDEWLLERQCAEYG